MDYKQKYEEALDNFKKIKAANKDNKELVDFIEYKYPELKESEDERVKTNIIKFLRFVHDTYHQYSDACNEAIAWLEKQGEQKPDFCHHGVDFSDCSEVYRKAYYDGWNNCNQQHAQLKAEQKPSWNVVDDNLLNFSIENLTELKNNFGDGYGRVGDCIHWLKSLKERYAWKPSDEQMNALKEACDERLEPDGLDPLYTLWEQLKKLKEE